MAVDATGDVFVVDSQHDRLVELPASGQQTTYASGLSYPQNVAVDAAGDVFVTEPYDNQVIEIAPSKTQTPVGSGLNFPYGVAVDSQGDVFIANTNSDQILEVNSNNTQTTVATVTTEVLGVAVDGSGDLFLGEFEAGEVLKLTPSGTESTVGSGLRYPLNMAVDAAGDVFIAEANEDQVVEVTPSGVQTDRRFGAHAAQRRRGRRRGRRVHCRNRDQPGAGSDARPADHGKPSHTGPHVGHARLHHVRRGAQRAPARCDRLRPRHGYLQSAAGNGIARRPGPIAQRDLHAHRRDRLHGDDDDRVDQRR